jgi:hypothetical protein
LSVCNLSKSRPYYAYNSALKFFQLKREQIDRKETAIGTVRNCVKIIKSFCKMADLPIPRKKVTWRLLKGKKYSDERIPTIEEIRKVFEQQIKLLLSVYNNNEPICKGMV